MKKNIYQVEKTTQLEVAVRQLVTAIELFFEDSDVFSIYSLTRNAEDIISSLLRENNKLSLWNDALNNYIKPEYKKQVLAGVNNPRNSLKHRKTKESGIVELPVGLNEYFIRTCVNALHIHWPDIWDKYLECRVFSAWTRTHHPEIFITRIEMIKGDEKLSKKEFFIKYKNLH